MHSCWFCSTWTECWHVPVRGHNFVNNAGIVTRRSTLRAETCCLNSLRDSLPCRCPDGRFTPVPWYSDAVRIFAPTSTGFPSIAGLHNRVITYGRSCLFAKKRRAGTLCWCLYVWRRIGLVSYSSVSLFSDGGFRNTWNTVCGFFVSL